MAGGKKVEGKPTDRDLLLALASPRYKERDRARDAIARALLAAPDEAVAYASRLSQLALVDAHAGARATLAPLTLPTLVAALPAGRALPATWDPLVTIFMPRDEVRAVLAAIPEPRRTRLALREIDAPNGALRLLTELLDLVPEATRPLLEAYESQGKGAWALSHPQLKKWKVPRIAALADEFRRRPREQSRPDKTAQPTRIGGGVSFGASVPVGVKDFATLSAIGRAQYCRTAGGFLGRAITNAREYAAEAKRVGLTGPALEMRRLEVSIRGEPRYDLWLIAVDNGTLFDAGTATVAPVSLLQDQFQAVGKGKRAKALAASLAKGRPRDLWGAAAVPPKRR